MNQITENMFGEGRTGATDDEALEKVIRRIRSSKEFPAISKYLIEINQKLANTSIYTTASELANTIIKDYGLTNKLLKLVNSAFYGVMAGKVTTVTRAVILLGYENVRLAASSLALFEHFQSKSSISDLKEAVICSFWCGVVARAIAVKNKSSDPEEAFICAMLHDLGRLLIIFHMPKEYGQIKLKAIQEGLEGKKAGKEVLGITYNALGRIVAHSWGFPDKISGTMSAFSLINLKKRNRAIDPLHVLAGFTSAMGDILLEEKQVNNKVLISALIGLFGETLGLKKENIEEIIQTSLSNVKKHADALQLGLEGSSFLKQLELYCDDISPDDKNNTVDNLSIVNDQSLSHFQLSDITSATYKALSGKTPSDPIAILMDGLQEVITAMAIEPDVNNIALISLEVIYRALKFNRVVLFINDTAKQTMEARFGYGCESQTIIKKVRFKIHQDAQDVFGLALNLSQDLIVEDACDAKLQQMMPEWHRKYFTTPAFVFFPIMYKKVCLGAIYADRKEKGVPISELEHRHVSMLRNQMILALKYCK